MKADDSADRLALKSVEWTVASTVGRWVASRAACWVVRRAENWAEPKVVVKAGGTAVLLAH